MTHAEELAKIAARLAEIAKEMAVQPAPSKICAVGDVKVIEGKRYKRSKEINLCEGCAFLCCNCPGDGDSGKSIENGGCECMDSVWVEVTP